MPTIMTHAAVPLALAFGPLHGRTPTAVLAAGVAASMLPDLDVVGFPLGISYSHWLGHRGASHSIAAALVAGALAAWTFRKMAAPARFSCFVAFCYASHGLLDTLTSGGLGVALLWPWSEERLFAPVRPILVSPIGRSFLSDRGISVLWSELQWIWLPCLLLIVVSRIATRKGKSFTPCGIDEP